MARRRHRSWDQPPAAEKLVADETALLQLLSRWRAEATKAGHAIDRIALAYEAGWDGFSLGRWPRDRAAVARPRIRGSPPPSLCTARRGQSRHGAWSASMRQNTTRARARTLRRIYQKGLCRCGQSALPSGSASPASRASSTSLEMRALAHIPTADTGRRADRERRRHRKRPGYTLRRGAGCLTTGGPLHSEQEPFSAYLEKTPTRMGLPICEPAC